MYLTGGMGLTEGKRKSGKSKTPCPPFICSAFYAPSNRMSFPMIILLYPSSMIDMHAPYILRTASCIHVQYTIYVQYVCIPNAARRANHCMHGFTAGSASAFSGTPCTTTGWRGFLSLSPPLISLFCISKWGKREGGKNVVSLYRNWWRGGGYVG